VPPQIELVAHEMKQSQFKEPLRRSSHPHVFQMVIPLRGIDGDTGGGDGYLSTFQGNALTITSSKLAV
jgi:hypothetical protein